MLKTHKIALDPNNKQMAVLARSAGVARFAYNWALSEWSRMYAEWQIDNDKPKPNQMLLRRNLNAIKRTEFPWMLDVTKCAPQEAIINLGRAFKNFFEGRGAYPAFKKKGVHDSFKVSSGFFRVEDKTIKIPHAGKIRMREELRFDGTPKSVTISRTANRWFASIAVEVSDTAPQTNCHIPAIGIDVGVNDFVQDDGSKIVIPQAYRGAEKRLRRAQKALSRKEKGSKNRKKAQMKVAKLHARASSIRSDFLHKYTTSLARNARTIVIEDLNVKGMAKNHHLAKSIANAAFGEFRRQ
ncbi:MAG: transposase, partial [Clostridiales Family XIII bacterium]|nr:transposase [Clostridiales Family XIII bacterium]